MKAENIPINLVCTNKRKVTIPALVVKPSVMKLSELKIYPT